jgi:hypothetical protein
MTSRAAQCAEQSDAERNYNFKRFRASVAEGPQYCEIRAWHADDPAETPISEARRLAERRWPKLTRELTP